ncbi:MAG: hypothetical protein K2P78_13750 [Gemmataceae bacterium]|nr:hypothetical protein [Gemmataceae bacterium]
MTISRWKIMAGVLGVSLGGLAAFAGPCKPAEHKTARADEPKAEAPKVVPPGGSGTADPLKLPEVPPPAAEEEKA